MEGRESGREEEREGGKEFWSHLSQTNLVICTKLRDLYVGV